MTTHSSDYGLLLQELGRKAALQHQPMSGSFELTERCNLSCSMCYIRCPATDVASRSRELSASDWLRIAGQAAENGMVFLLLTGGEVFLRPDFFDIYLPLSRLGLVVSLFTNATLITDAVAVRLAHAPPHRTEITLYGATASTYEAITGVPGSYARCCAGIEALLRHGLPLGLKTTVTQKNVPELDAMRQMAHSWGVPFSGAWLLTRRRDGTPLGVEKYRLSAKDCVALEAADPTSASQWSEAALQAGSLGDDANFYCLGGKASFAVTASGAMNVCLDLGMPSARPLESGFRAAWEAVQRFVDSALPMDTGCLSCAARPYCPRCPAWSALETGTLTRPVPYLCEIAYARKSQYQPDA